MKRNPYDYGMKAMEISYCWPAKKEPQFRKLLRKLVRDSVKEAYLHEGAVTSPELQDILARKLVP